LYAEIQHGGTHAVCGQLGINLVIAFGGNYNIRYVMICIQVGLQAIISQANDEFVLDSGWRNIRGPVHNLENIV